MQTGHVPPSPADDAADGAAHECPARMAPMLLDSTWLFLGDAGGGAFVSALPGHRIRR